MYSAEYFCTILNPFKISLQVLTLWYLISGVPFTQCDAQSIKHQVKMTAFHALTYADLS